MKKKKQTKQKTTQQILGNKIHNIEKILQKQTETDYKNKIY